MKVGCKIRVFLDSHFVFTLQWAVLNIPETASRIFGKINGYFRAGIPARGSTQQKWTPLQLDQLKKILIRIIKHPRTKVTYRTERSSGANDEPSFCTDTLFCRRMKYFQWSKKKHRCKSIFHDSRGFRLTRDSFVLWDPYPFKMNFLHSPRTDILYKGTF